MQRNNIIQKKRIRLGLLIKHRHCGCARDRNMRSLFQGPTCSAMFQGLVRKVHHTRVAALRTLELASRRMSPNSMHFHSNLPMIRRAIIACIPQSDCRTGRKVLGKKTEAAHHSQRANAVLHSTSPDASPKTSTRNTTPPSLALEQHARALYQIRPHLGDNAPSRGSELSKCHARNPLGRQAPPGPPHAITQEYLLPKQKPGRRSGAPQCKNGYPPLVVLRRLVHHQI